MVRHPQTDFCFFSYFPQNSSFGDQGLGRLRAGASSEPYPCPRSPAERRLVTVLAEMRGAFRILRNMVKCQGHTPPKGSRAHSSRTEKNAPSSSVNVGGFA